MINPELMLTRVLADALEDDECIVVTGTTQFSAYRGYAGTLEFAGEVEDTTPIDASTNVRMNQIVVMDALQFYSSDDKSQFSRDKVARELNKALVSFLPRDWRGYDAETADPDGTAPRTSEHDRAAGWPIATGNWGCGAFYGNKYLKFVVQWLAASLAKRDMHYYTFGDEQLARELDSFVRALPAETTVGTLFCALQVVCDSASSPGGGSMFSSGAFVDGVGPAATAAAGGAASPAGSAAQSAGEAAASASSSPAAIALDPFEEARSPRSSSRASSRFGGSGFGGSGFFEALLGAVLASTSLM